MKVYKKIVFDWNKDEPIYTESYDDQGPVTEMKGGGGGNPIKKVFKAVSKVFKKAVKAIVSFVGDVIGFVIKPLGVPDIPDFDAGAQAEGVKVTKPGTNQGIPLIYGYRRVGSIPIYAETSGSNNKDLYVVYAVAEGEIQGFRKIYIDGHFVGRSPDGTYYTAGKTYSGGGRYSGKLQFQCFNGTENQSQSSLANQAPNWSTKSRTMPGLAYVTMRFTWLASTQEEVDSNPYGGGLPQVEFELNGRKVYDVTTHAGGEDLATDYVNLTKTFSVNPANCLLDYMLNSRYGAGYSISEINADSFKIAADKFNQNITYDTGITGPAMTMNAVLDTNRKIIENVKIILGGCRSFMPYVQGRYKIKVEDGGNATDITSSTVAVAYDVTEDNLVGPVNLIGEAKNSKYNQVIVNYVDPMLEFSSQQVFYNEQGDKEIDDNEDLTGEFTFETITNKAIAQDFARMIYKKSRNQRQIQFTGTQELLNVEIGDIIRVSDQILNLNLQTFRVLSITLESAGTLKIEAVEHEATIYPHVTTAQKEIPPPLFLPDEYYNIVRTKPQEPVDLNYQNPDGVNPPDEGYSGPPKAETFVEFDNTVTTVGYDYKDASSFLLQNTVLAARTDANPSPNGLNGAVQILQQGSTYIGRFACKLPDGNITGMNVKVYDGTQLISQINYDFTIKISGFDPGSPQPLTATTPITQSVTTAPLRILRLELNKNYQYQILYTDEFTRPRFTTSGDISSWSGFTSHTYTLNGATISGTGLEAFVNYVKDTYIPDNSGSANLGG